MSKIMTLQRREFLGFLGATFAASGKRQLIAEWQQIASATDGVVGAAAMHLKSGEHAALNGDDSFPLASVCKVPIAMRLLALVDQGKLSLSENIEVLPRDVWQSWEGDVGSRWPKQRQLKLDELIRLMVAHSDNTAVQTVFRIGGEEPGMSACLRHWHAHGILLLSSGGTVRQDRAVTACRSAEAAPRTWRRDQTEKLPAPVALCSASPCPE